MRMIVIVFSNGRSGTNLILESLRGNSYLKATEFEEDKLLFKRRTKYPDRYLTKCDSVYVPDYKYIKAFMLLNPEAHIIFTIRHPYDWMLSKLYHGRIGAKGRTKPADDATIEGCKADMLWGYTLLLNIEKDFFNRINRIKMESFLRDPEYVSSLMCKYIGLPYEEAMCTPHLRMRHKGKVEKYGRKLDTSRIDVYKRIDTEFEGFFDDKKEDVNELFKWAEFLLKEYGY